MQLDFYIEFNFLEISLRNTAQNYKSNKAKKFVAVPRKWTHLA